MSERRNDRLDFALQGGALPQDEIVRRLATYLDPSVLRQILRADAPEQGEIKAEEVAVLFADIRGFTRFSQQIEPNKLIEILNEFMEFTGDCVHENEGIIDKFMGDCIMAYWRIRENADGLYAACKAALQIQCRADEFAASVLQKTGVDLKIGVGIHDGSALLCHVGNQAYMSYTVIGSTVNIACRLEEYAPGGEIYISEESAARLGDRIQTEPTETLQRRRNRDIAVPMRRLTGLM